ncbi:MAG: D-tyrosyl-tRNA(Tyr) deacylase [Clostridiales bacterium]|nr:D-tyrosyl-tRNA(Tyr) deacylase [Clostridiales bacterium]
MRAIIQRVLKSNVSVDNKIIGEINKGMTVFLGVGEDDTEKELDYIANKLLNLRIFEDDIGKMNFSIKDINGEILLISQFTLYGNTRKGNRPSFSKAAKPEKAIKLYNDMISYLNKNSKLTIKSGTFQAHMEVMIINDGPVTLIIDSKVARSGVK